MLKQFDSFKEEDFYVFAGPLKSRRQSPDSLAGNLLLSIFLLLVYAVLANFFVFLEWYPEKQAVALPFIIIYDTLILITIILSIVYGVEAVYKTRQASQYLFSIWLSQLIFGQSIFLISMYLIYELGVLKNKMDVTAVQLGSFVITCYVVGIIIYFISLQRMVFLMKKGTYREGTSFTRQRQRREEAIKSWDHKYYIIKGVIAIVASIAGLGGWLGVDDVELFVISTVGLSVFFIMFFILPEQMVIWYCIRRFQSFQYNENAEEHQEE